MRTDFARFAVHRLWTSLLAMLVLLGLVDIAGPYVLDPSILLMGDASGAEDLAQIRSSLGLDAPWYERIASGATALATPDETRSYRFGLPVAWLLAERWRPSIAVMVWATSCAVVLGTSIGALASRWIWVRLGLLRTWTAVLVLPSFVAASWVASQPYVASLELPRATLAGLLLGGYGGLWFALATHRAFADEGSSWHIRALRALGMPRLYLIRAVLGGVVHHVLGSLDLLAAVLLTGGTVVVEYTFHIEGLGLLLLDSLMAMDLPVVRTLLALGILAYIGVSTLILLVRGRLDPRLWQIEK